MIKFISRLHHDAHGVTAVEYALIILLVVVGLVAFVTELGSATNRPFVTANSAMNTNAP